MQLLVLVVLYYLAVKKMVVHPTVLSPASVDLQNVRRIPVSIVTNLSILAQLCAATWTEPLLIKNNAHVDQPGVLLMLAFIVLNLPIPAHHVLLQPVRIPMA